MKPRLFLRFFCMLTLAACLCAGSALAHFGAIIPSDDIITHDDSRKISLDIQFIHPMEGDFMDMARPKAFGVVMRGKKLNLSDTLRAVKGKGLHQTTEHTFWKGHYQIQRPGDHLFYMEPAPYWEPAEDIFIVHYTKVCVHALGLEEGWDAPVGLETEIMPLVRPYGLWTHNLFSGQVLLKGKPRPFAEVEVEYLNGSAKNKRWIQVPADPYVTQVIKADANGVFSYAMPREGWWGFSALSQADWTLSRDGQEKKVEIGAVFWVRILDME